MYKKTTKTCSLIMAFTHAEGKFVPVRYHTAIRYHVILVWHHFQCVCYY